MQTGYALRDIASTQAKISVPETTDEALIAAIAGGDKRAMQVLYARHNVRVFRFIVRLTGNTSTAEDLVSEVFLDVWRQADAFEAKCQVSTWLLAIARNRCINLLKRNRPIALAEPVSVFVVPALLLVKLTLIVGSGGLAAGFCPVEKFCQLPAMPRSVLIFPVQP